MKERNIRNRLRIPRGRRKIKWFDYLREDLKRMKINWRLNGRKLLSYPRLMQICRAKLIKEKGRSCSEKVKEH